MLDGSLVWPFGANKETTPLCARRCNSLNIAVHCNADIGVSHQFLDRCYANLSRGDRVQETSCWIEELVDGIGCNCLNRKGWALNSAVECHLHTLPIPIKSRT